MTREFSPLGKKWPSSINIGLGEEMKQTKSQRRTRKDTVSNRAVKSINHGRGLYKDRPGKSTTVLGALGSH